MSTCVPSRGWQRWERNPSGVSDPSKEISSPSLLWMSRRRRRLACSRRSPSGSFLVLTIGRLTFPVAEGNLLNGIIQNK